IRMSRNFGMKMLTMTNLSTECLIQLTKLGYDATPFNQILKQNAKREMRLRLGKVTVADVLAAQPVTTNLLKFMRASIRSEERFSRNAETDLVCRLLLEKKKDGSKNTSVIFIRHIWRPRQQADRRYLWFRVVIVRGKHVVPD